MSAASFVTAQIFRVLPRARLGRAVGSLAERPWPSLASRAVVGAYSWAYDVAFDDCEQRSGWSNFDAFFTRKLRDGARPIESDPGCLVSPADGRVESVTPIDGSAALRVKGRPYTVDELVGDPAEAVRFRGGVGVVVYLSPRDYHRVHAPVGGSVRRVRSIPGDYFPVNSVGMRHIPKLLSRNRRVCIEIDSDSGFGRVTVVMVVAMIVGRITTTFLSGRDVPFGDHGLEPPRLVKRGDEIGVFHLGSTAVVLVEKASLAAGSASEGPVRMGEALLQAGADRAGSSSGGEP